jgi:mono/diheme cytochrome c family protein
VSGLLAKDAAERSLRGATRSAAFGLAWALAWASSGGLFACASTAAERGDVSDADVWRGRVASARGARGFGVECSHCHGARGEGVANLPAVLGAGALPVYPRELALGGAPGLHDLQQMEIDSHAHRGGLERRGPFRTGGDLFDYLKRHLPKPQERDFHDEDYAAIVGFMLTVQGSEIPPGGPTLANVESVLLVHR